MTNSKLRLNGSEPSVHSHDSSEFVRFLQPQFQLRLEMGGQGEADAKAPVSELERYAFDGSCKRSAGGDFTLVFDDGTRLVAHKAVLSVASPVVEARLAFSTDSASMRVTDVSAKVWRMLLHLVYPIHVTRKAYASISPDTFVNISAEADKYGIDKVKEIIQEVFEEEVMMDSKLWLHGGTLASDENRLKVLRMFAECAFKHGYSEKMKQSITEKLAAILCKPGYRTARSESSSMCVPNIPNLSALNNEDMQACLRFLPKDWVIKIMNLAFQNAQRTENVC